MILHLIRHGKTIANEKKLYCGATDLPLSKAGIQELLVLKEQIDYPSAELYVVSGLLRTIETANLLFDQPMLNTILQLQEINFGKFEMRGYEELRQDLAYQKWLADVERVAPLGGECKQTFTKRVMEGLQKVEKLCYLNVTSSAVVVTHGGVITTVMESYFPQQKNFYQWQPACGRGYTLHLGENKCYGHI